MAILPTMTKRTKSAAARATGGCLCGAVRYTVRGPLRSTVTACHCRTCRRFTGGLWAGTVARREHVILDDPQARKALKWFRSSESGERGFCRECGTSLFGHDALDTDDLLAIAAGSLDEPTGLRLACHGWTSQAADFWDFGADVPLRDGPSGLGPPEDS